MYRQEGPLEVEGLADGVPIPVSGSFVFAPPTTVVNGQKLVTTAGTRVALAGSTTVQAVTIKALATNTGLIYVGNATVADTNGLQLAAGEAVSLDIANLASLYLDSAVNGEGVTYLGVA